MADLNSADSALSASELRQRYLKGGSLPDDALSASQLRSRHGLASNTRGFSTSEWASARGGGGGGGGGGGTRLCGLPPLAALLALAVVLALAALGAVLLGVARAKG